ncbi:MAG: beta-lactamase family protein [Verrucomicrobia bacterium]|nr:beta-lactamase family protein [Verrucomicrobiota bacterium]
MLFPRSALRQMLRHFTAFLVLATATAALAQDLRPSAALVSAIDRLVARSGIDESSPGVAIFIRVPGRLQFQKGYGLASVKDGTPITPSTLFELASCSKPFTATALLMLVDRGMLTLDDDVRDYIPELPEYSSDNPILIRDLLQHTSGLPEYFDFDDEDVPMRHKTYAVNEDYLGMFARLKKDYPLEFRTGSKHEYTNSNYLLLATIVQRVAKQPFSEFVRDEIFLPAGMQHTFVCQSPKSVPQTEDDDKYNRAFGYEWREKKETWKPSWGTPPEWTQKVMVVGDGGVWSNLEDMAKWDAAVRARKFLKPATWKEALTPGTTRKGKAFDYGLGWVLYTDDDGSVHAFGHDGTWAGFENSYYRDLGSKRSTIILSNRDSLDTDELYQALDALVDRHVEE